MTGGAAVSLQSFLSLSSFFLYSVTCLYCQPVCLQDICLNLGISALAQRINVKAPVCASLQQFVQIKLPNAEKLSCQKLQSQAHGIQCQLLSPIFKNLLYLFWKAILIITHIKYIAKGRFVKSKNKCKKTITQTHVITLHQQLN